MNSKQKKALLFCLILFLASLVYVPHETNIHAAMDTTMPKTIFHGFVLITEVNREISLKILAIEWFAISVIFVALFFLLKEK